MEFISEVDANFQYKNYNLGILWDFNKGNRLYVLVQ